MRLRVVMNRLMILGLFAAMSSWADARYKLAYRVKANTLIQLVAGFAGLNKLDSEGEEVLLKGSRVMVKGEKSSIILDYATGKMILIDHTDKTFEKLRIEDMKQRISGDIPGPMIEGLKRMFPGGGSGIATEVKVERVGGIAVMKSAEQFRSRHGLSYLLPAMESIVALTPAVQKGLEEIRSRGELVEALRVQIGVGGKVVDAFVEIRDYREASVAEGELQAPAGYVEVK